MLIILEASEEIRKCKTIKKFKYALSVQKVLILAIALEYKMLPCRVTNSYLKSRLCFRLWSGSWQPAWQDEAPLPLHPRLDGFPGLHARLLLQVGLIHQRE
jgi:hypothetical protein